jgi:glycerol-3-phosphate O-acyltransferase
MSDVLLIDVSSAAERDAVQRWIDSNCEEPLETVMLDDGRLESLLSNGGDPLLRPVGVAWLPPEYRGRRRARFRDLVSLSDPWHPRPAAQRKILREAPDRCEVVIGEPARASALRRRYERNPGGAFADYVRRQAHLTLERAVRAMVGVQYKVPKLVYEEITDSERFSEGVAALAEELGLDEAEVHARATDALGEMVASQSRTAIDLWDQFGRFLSRAHRITVDDARIEALRDLGRRRSLIFLPSHRSYLDPLVLRPALLSHGLPPNHVLGGLNVSFWPIGPITRRSSYVFIRRQFRGDDVYRWTLQQYMTYLVRKRFNIEWYIEGGRSRTGKLRPPRYGILGYLVDGMRAEQIDDAYIVPTSITYEQLHEVGDMAAQSRGGTKTKEDLPWLVGYARSQGRGLGRVHIAFGEPLSLRESLGEAYAADADKAEVRLAVQKTAFEVMHRINSVTPVTHTAIAGLALLSSDYRALTEAEIGEICAELVAHAEHRGITVKGDPAAAIRELVDSKVIERFDGGTEPVYRIADNQHLVAAFYANSAVHAFVVRAIAELAQRSEDPDEAALALRDLLKFEFFFGEKEEFLEDVRGELERELPLLVAPRVLRPLLEAQLVAAQSPDDVTGSLGIAHQWHLQGVIHSADAVSTELLDAAHKLIENRGGETEALAEEVRGWLELM